MDQPVRKVAPTKVCLPNHSGTIGGRNRLQPKGGWKGELGRCAGGGVFSTLGSRHRDGKLRVEGEGNRCLCTSSFSLYLRLLFKQLFSRSQLHLNNKAAHRLDCTYTSPAVKSSFCSSSIELRQGGVGKMADLGLQLTGNPGSSFYPTLQGSFLPYRGSKNQRGKKSSLSKVPSLLFF